MDPYNILATDFWVVHKEKDTGGKEIEGTAKKVHIKKIRAQQRGGGIPKGQGRDDHTSRIKTCHRGPLCGVKAVR